MKYKLISFTLISLILLSCGEKEDYYWKKEDGKSRLFSSDKSLVGELIRQETDGIRVSDRVERIDSHTFLVTRDFQLDKDVENAVLSIDFVHHSPCDYWMIPSVSYNGNEWGRGKEPKGASDNGIWRTFSYRRTPVPGATYSEGEQFAVAMWGKVPQNETEDFSCSIQPEEVTTHRLIWPEEEIPTVYSGRDKYADGYRKQVSLKKGQTVSLQAYIAVTPVKKNHYAMRDMVDIWWQQAEKSTINVYQYQQIWDLGVRYAKESLWAEEGVFKGFSIGLVPDGSGWKQRTGGKYEIGWCGQNASFANSLLVDYMRTGDDTSLQKGVETLDCWATYCRLPNGLFVIHFDHILNQYKDGIIDACNLGTAALNYFEAYDLTKEIEISRPEYEQLAFDICRFVCNDQQPNGVYARGWKEDGSCYYREGTIGCFMVPPMLEAYSRSGDEAFLQSAKRAYSYYLEGLLVDGYSTAGALDTWCIDKESSISLLRSSLMLYKITRDKKYVDYAEAISAYLSTWMWHYTGVYPEGDNFTIYKYQTFGGTSVSTQHHHLDPYALMWVPDWIELSDLTDDSQWKEKALAIWKNGCQLVSDGTLEINGRIRPAGAQNEAFYESNWSASGDNNRINYWLVAWPGAFRLETIRRLGDRAGMLDN